ncbi:M15 family metallopeptidase [Nocardioides humi]|uniref:M15 family metallopeptidase n=1 Tax=Nocardioides humi TaxID=449461 RepID=A0ABN1ZXQ2_9ACTN|nr:M15 family metallopeptidase [Nocardioides humi]
MTILLSDPRVRAVPVVECGEPLVRLPHDLSPAGALVRAGLAERLVAADRALPAGIRLRVVEGFRSLEDQRAIVSSYGAELAALHPGIDAGELERLTSRFVAPVDVAPHVAGAAVDLTLIDIRARPKRSRLLRAALHARWRRCRSSTGHPARLRSGALPSHAHRDARDGGTSWDALYGDELDLGTPIDATPEQSDGRCWFAAGGIGADARAHRTLLADVLGAQGLVNYPTEWWHWSHGDRYWALTTGAPHAVYGPLSAAVAA